MKRKTVLITRLVSYAYLQTIVNQKFLLQRKKVKKVHFFKKSTPNNVKSKLLQITH